MASPIIIKKVTGGGGGGPATRVAEEITFGAAHGFSVGQWIYQSGTSAFALARANAAATAIPSGVVESIPSPTKVVLVRQGIANISSAALAAGNVMYLSADLAGAMVSVPPEAEGTLRTVLGRGISSSSMEVSIGVPDSNEKIPYASLAADVAAGVGASLFAGATNGQSLVWNEALGRPVPGAPIPDVSVTQNWQRVNVSGAAVDLLAGVRMSKTLEVGETWAMTFTNFGAAMAPIYLFVNCKGAATINFPSQAIPGTAQPTAGKTNLYIIHPTTSFAYIEKSATVWDLDIVNPTVPSWTVVPAGNMIEGIASEGVKIYTGGAGGWTITASGGAVTATGVIIDGTTINIVLSRVINGGETVSLTYVNPSNTGITDLYNNPLGNFSGTSVLNSSLMSNYLLKFNFETGAAYPGSTESGSTFIAWNSVSSPISGTYSGKIGTDGTSTYRFLQMPFTKASGYVDLRMRVRLNSRATSTNQTFIELLTALSGGTSVAQIQDRTDGGLRLSSGGALVTTSASYTTGNNWTVWLRYEVGTGNNAKVTLWMSNSGSLTRPGTAAATITTSTATGLAAVLRIGARSGIDITVDDIFGSETALGDGAL